MTQLAVEHLRKEFALDGKRFLRAVDDISFGVVQGEILVLLGPSGCGKTTALRLIAGLEAPSQGTVTMDGKIMNGVPAKDREVGMVFQQPALYPHMTAYDNIAFGLKLRHHSREDIGQSVKDTASLLGLADCLGRRPEELSGGERQRVALGRALARNPKVLLLDEPLSNLDAPLRYELRSHITRLRRELQTTLVYVTHDQAEAMSLGDRIAVMRAGKIEQIGTSMEIYQKPNNLFVAGFVGSPPMNFLTGTLISNGKELMFSANSSSSSPSSSLPKPVQSGPPLQLALPPDRIGALNGHLNKPVVLGLRPEDIRIGNDRNGALQGMAIEVQHLGPETHIRLEMGGLALTARAPSPTDVRTGETISAQFQMERTQFFEPGGNRIG